MSEQPTPNEAEVTGAAQSENSQQANSGKPLFKRNSDGEYIYAGGSEAELLDAAKKLITTTLNEPAVQQFNGDKTIAEGFEHIASAISPQDLNEAGAKYIQGVVESLIGVYGAKKPLGEQQARAELGTIVKHVAAVLTELGSQGSRELGEVLTGKSGMVDIRPESVKELNLNRPLNTGEQTLPDSSPTPGESSGE